MPGLDARSRHFRGGVGPFHFGFIFSSFSGRGTRLLLRGSLSQWRCADVLPKGRLHNTGQSTARLGLSARFRNHSLPLLPSLFLMNLLMPFQTFPRSSARCSARTSDCRVSRCLIRRSAQGVSGTPSRRGSGRSAFTLLELLLVLSILVVIGGIVVVNISGAKSDADINATQAQLNSLKGNIVYYKLKMNTLPDSLENLVEGPSDSAKKAKWVDSIIESVPVDAWGNAFDFSTKGNEFEIKSGGLDGQMNTDDDIVVSGR